MRYLLTITIALLAVTALWAQPKYAVTGYSNTNPTERKAWIDLQVVQSFGLDQWSDNAFINDLLPRHNATDLRVVGNMKVVGPVGLFADMGLSILPSASDPQPNMNSLPKANQSRTYFLREELSSNPCDAASAQFRMSGGVFCDIATNNPKLSVTPYAGFGLLTFPYPEYSYITKEQGTNMQYNTEIYWNDDPYATNDPLGYFTARLNFGYRYSERSRLLFGIEYTHMLNAPQFFITHTSSHNANLSKTYSRKCNNMSMLGVSIGISFR